MELIILMRISLIYATALLLFPSVCSNDFRCRECYSQTTTCDYPVDSQTYLALNALYNSTNGANWKWLEVSSSTGNKWNFSDVKSVSDGAQRPCRDDWQGLSCSASATNPELCDIITVSLENFNLQGRLPDEIGNISAVKHIDLSLNELSGTLPTTIGMLSRCEQLYLLNTNLAGVIPTEIGNMRSMLDFQFQKNHVTGSIPSEFYKMKSLLVINIGHNQMTGTISPLIGQLHDLQEIFIASTSLTGTIPTELALLNSTDSMTFQDCRFSGTLPSEFGALNKMAQIVLSGNYFSGQLSTEFGRLSAMTIFSVGVNMVSGSIPTEFGRLNLLVSLTFSINCMTGPIPSEIGNLILLEDLSLAQNKFTGTLPTQLGSLSSLQLLYIDSNEISGSFPMVVEALTSIEDLILEGNLLTSTLPTELTLPPNILGFAISVNYFTGTIVDTLPSSLAMLEIFLNYFAGPLDVLFPAEAGSKFPKLVLLEVSQNGFTGSFPSSLFGLPFLETLLADINCFSGKIMCPDDDSSLPPRFSNRSSLRALDLTGLSSGVGCRNYIVERSILPNSGYYPEHYITGTIPQCVWNMPHLKTLFMVGNGFTGPIKSDNAVVNISQMVNLSFASNELTGTIPDFILAHNFSQLDLSSNRLHGRVNTELIDVCSPHLILDLSVNRLSGGLALSNCELNSLASNVLEGNMFTFDLQAFPADNKEEALAYYGSFTLDVAMWVASPVLMLTVIMLTTKKVVRFTNCRPSAQRRGLKLLMDWQKHWKLILLPVDVMYYFNTFVACGQLLVMILFTAVGTTLILYCSLKASSTAFATYSNQYSWIASAAFLHGSVPVISISVVLTVWIVGVAVWIVPLVHPGRLYRYVASVMKTYSSSTNERTFSNYRGEHITSIESESVESHHSNSKSTETVSKFDLQESIAITFKLVVLFGLNVGIVGLANWGYLVAVLNNSPQILFIQVGLSGFKLIWNAVYVGEALKWIRNPSSNAVQCNPMIFRFAVKLINFVIIPCVATMLVDGNCFLKLFVQQPAPELYSARCDGVRNVQNGTLECDGSITNDYSIGEFEPPFMYSFQCSSAVITNYVPVLLYAYSLSGFVVPLFFVCCMLLSCDNDTKDDVARFSTTFRSILKYLPRVMRPMSANLGANRNQLADPLIPNEAGQLQISNTTIEEVQLFPLNALISTQLLNISLFFTFGLAFSYLGAVILCSAVLELMVWLLAIGKYHYESTLLSETSQQSSCTPQQVNALVTLTVRSATFITRRDLFLVLVVVWVFWSAMFFDMIGDLSGKSTGITVMLIAMFLGPIWCIFPIVASQFVYDSWLARRLPSISNFHNTHASEHPSYNSNSTSNGVRSTSGSTNSFRISHKPSTALVDERFSINNSGLSPLNSEFANSQM